jgi:hypothetical protein
MTENDFEPNRVIEHDRMALRVWLGCWAILWMLGLVNWATNLWGH